MLDSGFIEFKLDYLKTKDLAIGGNVCSEEFVTAGGYTWAVVCYPRGNKQADNGEYLSLFISLRSTIERVKAMLDVCVMRRDGQPSLPNARRGVQVYLKGCNQFGWSHFVRRSELEAHYVMGDGLVRFICGVIVLHENQMSVPPSDIGIHLGRLLDCNDGSDVSFSVGGEVFRAHRAVLAARSPVFKAQLFGSMADATKSRITLHDIQAPIFQILLRFMYTDSLPNAEELPESSKETEELFHHLLAAADMYHLDRLKLMCAQKLWDGVSVANVATTLCYAEMHRCPELKNKCIDFFLEEKNFTKVVLTAGYLRLMQDFPSVIDEIRVRVEG